MERAMLKTALGLVLLGYMTTVCVLFGPYGAFGRPSEPRLTMVEEEPAPENQDFSWDKAPSLEHLEWQKCYDSFQCARLSVPLNYAEPTGRKASIALIRKPADVDPKSSKYRGPVLINPGGPGGSGVDTVLGYGKLLGEVVGPEFDILGFDPRGVSRSTPRASFFKTPVDRALWNTNVESYMRGPESVASTYARSQAVGGQASKTDDGSLRFLNTDHTARDMLSIVRAHGEEKLQYWGFSYGSVLGATFASMFPDNVGRVVIDGVEDAENYYATLWDNNLLDTDKTMHSFYQGCADAGEEGCAFWAPTADQIRTNLTLLYDSLKTEPLAAKLSDGRFGIVNHDFLRSAVFTALYKPFAFFPRLAEALSDLAKGDGRALFLLASGSPFQCGCCGKDVHAFDNIEDGGMAVRCNDGDEVSGGLKEMLRHYNYLSKESEWGPTWSAIRISCAGWPKFPKDTFHGPFIANTSHPLLVVGNTADPVTPLWAAHKMAKGFEGAVVLTQDSPGHCSLAMPSTCTHTHIRRYFKSGELPPPGTICPTIKNAFPDGKANDSEGLAQAVFSSAEEASMAKAVEELSRAGLVYMLH